MPAVFYHSVIHSLGFLLVKAKTINCWLDCPSTAKRQKISMNMQMQTKKMVRPWKGNKVFVYKYMDKKNRWFVKTMNLKDLSYFVPPFHCNWKVRTCRNSVCFQDGKTFVKGRYTRGSLLLSMLLQHTPGAKLPGLHQWFIAKNMLHNKTFAPSYQTGL